MSIFRSGVLQTFRVRALKDIQDIEVTVQAGELYDVVMAMDTMYVIRGPGGRDLLVPKEKFETVTEEKPKKS